MRREVIALIVQNVSHVECSNGFPSAGRKRHIMFYMVHPLCTKSMKITLSYLILHYLIHTKAISNNYVLLNIGMNANVRNGVIA